MLCLGQSSLAHSGALLLLVFLLSLELRCSLLIVRASSTILACSCVYLLVGEAWKLLSGVNVADVLAVTFGEDKVDLFQRALRRLRVEEVDDRKEDCVEDREEKVGSPTNAIDEYGRDHDNEKVPKPVGDGGDSVGLGAGLQRVYLGGIEPWQWEPGGTEESDIGEETDSGSLRGGFSIRDEGAEGKYHGKALSDSTPEEELAASDTLDGEPGSCSKDRVDDHVDSSEQESHLMGDTNGVLDDVSQLLEPCHSTSMILPGTEWGNSR